MKSKAKVVHSQILSKDYNTLKRLTIHYQKQDGTVQNQIREVYHKDSGAAVLLYNSENKTVVLTRQFRAPIYVNEGNRGGMAIEVCAGLLEGMSPLECAKKEALEETGYQITEVTPVFEAYMIPGSVTEKVYMFIAAYNETMKVSNGGGLEEEQEEIEVLELDFETAYQLIYTGEIQDAKTIMLLQYAKLHNILDS